jgi:periplasmic protein TonB
VRSVITAAVVLMLAGGGALAQQSKAYKIGDEGVKAPVLVKEVKPRYTDGAKARQVEGKVELSVVILSTGRIAADVTVKQSLDPELDEQAIAAVKQWEFKPGTKDDKPVDVRADIEMTFSLRL